MPGYELYLHIGVLDSVPEKGPQRRRIFDFIRHLKEHPDTLGDFTDKDASLRERQIKIVGDYAITFWLDAPVKIIMVVDISQADR